MCEMFGVNSNLHLQMWSPSSLWFILHLS